MPLTPGDNGRKNPLIGVGTALRASSSEISAYNETLKVGSLVYNTTTRELKVADGLTPLASLPDHEHPHTYAPVIHSHMYGANQPWLVSEPRLWYFDDVENHPELVALDGSELDDEKAEQLSEVYPGSFLLSKSGLTLTSNGFENSMLTLTADEWETDYFAGNVFNDELTVSNAYKMQDQWLTTSSSLSTTHTLTVTFKGGHTYRPTEYWIIPAAGTSTAVVARRPVPKSWTFEGSNDGSTWTVLDTHTDVAASTFEPLEVTTFAVSTNDSYAYLRLVITAWSEGDEEGMECGLRRLWIFGRKQGVFTLPNITPPSDEFVWVVPYKNMNVGLIHEDIGDVGRTALTSENLPAYRLATDGASYAVTAYPELYASIGHTCDHLTASSATTASDGAFTGDDWTVNTTDPATAVHVDYTLGGAMPGFYKITAGEHKYPLSWVIEGIDSSGNYTTLQTIEACTAEEFEAANGTFYLDTNLTDAAYTTIRLNVLSWNSGQAGNIGYDKIEWYTHVVNQFYVPTMTSDIAGTIPYIVADHTATDVSSAVIQRLQQNIIDLTSLVGSLQDQLTTISETKGLNSETYSGAVESGDS